MTLNAALGNAGALHQIEWGGRAYTASLVVQRLKTQFTRWLQKRAYGPILVMAEAGARQPDIDAAVIRFGQRCEAGEFEFDAERARRLFDPEGPNLEAAVALVSFILNADEPTALAIMQGKPLELRIMMESIMRESFPPPNGERGTPAAALPPTSSTSPPAS